MKESSGGNHNNTGKSVGSSTTPATTGSTSHEPSSLTSNAQVGVGAAGGPAGTSSTSNNMTTNNKDGGATASTTSSSSNIDNISNQAVLEFLRKHGLHQAEQELQTFMNSSSKRNENDEDASNKDSKRTSTPTSTGNSASAAAASVPLWNPSKVEQDEKNRQTDGTGGSSATTSSSKPAITSTSKSGGQGPTPMDVDGSGAAQQKVIQQQQSLLNRSTGGGMMGYDLDHASILPTWASTNTAAGSGHPQQVIRGLRKYGCQEAKQLIDSFVELQTWFTSLPGDIINHNMMGQQPSSAAATNNANTMIKSELLPVCFALLANSYCELLEGGMDSDAKALLDRYGPWYNKYFSNEVRELQRLGSSSSSSSAGSGSGTTNKTSASASFISWNANVMKQRELMEDNRQMQYQIELLKQDIEKRQALVSQDASNSNKHNSIDTSPATIKTLQEDLRLLNQRLELSSRNELELRQNHVEPYRFMVRLRGSGSSSHRLPLRMTTRAYSMLMTFLNSTPHVLPMSVLLMAKCIIEVQPDTTSSVVTGPTSFKPSPSLGSSSYYPPLSNNNQQQQQQQPPPPSQFSSFGSGPGHGRHPSQPYGVGGGGSGSAPTTGGTNTNTTMMGPNTSHHPSWTSGGGGSSGMNNMPGQGMQQQQQSQPQQPFHPGGGSYPSAGSSSNAPPPSYHPPNQTNIMTTGGRSSTMRPDTSATSITTNEPKINNTEPLRLLEVPNHSTTTLNNVMDDVSSRQRMNLMRNQLISYTNQEFNQALLINGFRRLEALETEKMLRDERLSKLAQTLKEEEEKKDTDDKKKDDNDDDPLSSIMEQSSSKRLRSATGATVNRSSNSLTNTINIDEQTILMATFADATSPSVIDYGGVGGTTTTAASVPLLQEAGMEITCARFSPDDGRRIAIGCDDSVVRVWFLDQSSSELVAKQQKPIYDSSTNSSNALSESHVMLIGHKCSWPVFGLDWGPDGRHLISCGGDGSIRLWDTSAVGTKGTLVKAIKKKSGSTPTMTLSSSTGSGGGDMSNVGGLATSTTTTSTSTMEAAMAATSPIVPGQRGLDPHSTDSSTRATTAVEIGGAALAVYYGHCDGTAVWNCRFAPCGYYFASCGSDSTTNIWVTERISPVRCLVSGHPHATSGGGGGGVNCLSWHPNVNYLLTGSGNLQDRTCRLYDIQTGKCVRILSGFDGWLSSVEISPDGRTAATVDSTGMVATYDLASGRRMCEFGSPMPPGHNSICFNSSGTVLASGAGDGCVVKLWDVARAHRLVSYHHNNSHHQDDDSGGEEEKKSNDDTGATTTTAPLPVFSSTGGNNRRQQQQQAVMTVPSTKIFTTKDTLTLDVRFTKRNLLLCAGKYSPIGGMF